MFLWLIRKIIQCRFVRLKQLAIRKVYHVIRVNGEDEGSGLWTLNMYVSTAFEPEIPVKESRRHARDSPGNGMRQYLRCT